MQLRDAIDVANEILLREIAPSSSKITLIILERRGASRSTSPLLNLNVGFSRSVILLLPLTIRGRG